MGATWTGSGIAAGTAAEVAAAAVATGIDGLLLAIIVAKMKIKAKANGMLDDR